MEYQQFLKDFVERTDANLKIIQKQSALHGEGYEVTQLINSCLGLIVFVNEEKGQESRNITFETLQSEQTAHEINFSTKSIQIRFYPIRYDPEQDHINGQHFLEHMRHAIAHCNIDFIIHDGNIVGMTFQNIYNGRFFDIAISIEELSKLLNFHTTEILDEHH